MSNAINNILIFMWGFCQATNGEQGKGRLWCFPI